MTPARLLLTITEMLGKVDVRAEEPINRRRDRTSTITVRGAIADGLQPPDVSSAITGQLQPIIDKLPAGYSASGMRWRGCQKQLDHELRQFGVRVTCGRSAGTKLRRKMMLDQLMHVASRPMRLTLASTALVHSPYPIGRTCELSNTGCSQSKRREAVQR